MKKYILILLFLVFQLVLILLYRQADYFSKVNINVVSVADTSEYRQCKYNVYILKEVIKQLEQKNAK